MRKLSMKKLGTPASDEPKARGSGGVSADGAGARRAARTPPARAPPTPSSRPGCADDLGDLAFACAWVRWAEPPLRLVPCDRCACTWGAHSAPAAPAPADPASGV